MSDPPMLLLQLTSWKLEMLEQQEFDQNSVMSTLEDVPLCKIEPAQEAVPQSSDEAVISTGVEPKLVTWQLDDADNPRNWTRREKWTNLVMVSLICFMSPLSSTILAAALPRIGSDLHLTSEVELQAIFSVFTLGYIVGPVFLSPLSDIYGRVIVLQLSNVVHLLANAACAAAMSSTTLILLRLVAGMGGSASLIIGGGVIGETFKPDERGSAVAVYSLAPIAGPTLGPILGAFLVQRFGLPSVFLSTSIASAAFGAIGFFVLRETNSRCLLRDRAARLRKETGDSAFHTQWDDQKISRVFVIAMRRPFYLLYTQPMAMLLVFFQSYLWGLLYLAFSIYIYIFTGVFRQSVDTASLNYLAFLAGNIVSVLISGTISDRIYRGLRARLGRGVDKAIFRLPMTVLGVVAFAAGLIVIGWAAQQRTSILTADVGGALFAMGSFTAYQSLQALMIDAFGVHATSILSAAAMVRSLASFLFPLAAPALFARLGFGWGHTLIALVALFFGGATVVLTWCLGERLTIELPTDL
ncbi:major facilitator superfamily transporter [Colletotrichum graminicola]|uniref:Major facilitator superfamily transporter n=1 Tax=Colletotrichum graminicola (strain M1.001 / M2 / FGSC 10212) TaxID=645133 RepID=E3R0X6_COLGM|nr:major facilitator superfamily transporter [Colletotrichum graminicola M1.001]EFQ36764.1 major facilitator superfamily transporter [Colletotrichum graminicola M1.001]WDK19633.1 major facilitator superfamily transporter [Colletotrichum graminicola]